MINGKEIVTGYLKEIWTDIKKLKKTDEQNGKQYFIQVLKSLTKISFLIVVIGTIGMILMGVWFLANMKSPQGD